MILWCLVSLQVTCIFNTWPASVILKELSQIFTQNSLFILTILKDIMNT